MVEHLIQLKGSYPSADSLNNNRPNILAFKEQNFIEKLLSGLKTKLGRNALRDKLVETTEEQSLRLYQPVHRLFNVLLLDVNCIQFGEPRLAPEKIHSSGYVIRKVDDAGNEYAWMKKEGELVGWKPVDAINAERQQTQLNYDVEPDLRKLRQLGKNKLALEKRSLITTPYQAYEEDHSRLFLTSPQVMKSANKTYLYGVLNLTSNEWSEEINHQSEAPFNEADIQTRLPVLLKQGSDERFTTEYPKPPVNDEISKSDRELTNFAALKKVLSYLANEVGLFTGGVEVDELKNILSHIPISITENNQQFVTDYYVFLLSAYQVFYGFPEDADGDSITVDSTMTPDFWPTISSENELLVVAAIDTAMQARWNRLQPSKPRFENQEKYRVYAFIRVKGHNDCPLKTIWSTASSNFEIVPWYETSDQIPATQIELPDINAEMLTKLKPNVAFKVPESIQKIMDKINLNDMLDGKEIKGSGLGFGMICGFSIPLITICAFIVLQIFLVLLNLIFWWLPFIKVCIPFPKSK